MGVPLGPVFLYMAFTMLVGAFCLAVAAGDLAPAARVATLCMAGISFFLATAGLIGYVFNARVDRWSDE